MRISYYVEKLMPCYKKYLAKKLATKYEEVLYEYFIVFLPISDKQFKEYIFVDKIIENPMILFSVLIEFREKYLDELNLKTEKERKKEMRKITLYSIMHNTDLLIKFAINTYNRLRELYITNENNNNNIIDENLVNIVKEKKNIINL